MSPAVILFIEMQALALAHLGIETDGVANGDDDMLVRKAVDGDRRAFESIYRRHVGSVYGLCRRLTNSVADAEDCTQDTFVKAWQRLDGFRGDSALGTWLHSIAVHECLGRQRKAKRERRHLEVVSMPTSHAAGPDGQLEELEKAVAKLPTGARNVFVLLAVYGYSHEEAAAILEIATGTCKAQLHRARKLLGGWLQAPNAGRER